MSMASRRRATLALRSREQPDGRGGGPTVRLLAGEWTKLVGLPSTGLLLALGVMVTVGVSGLTCWLTARDWASLDATSRAHFDPVVTSLQGIPFGQLAFGVLGALAVTREYATGTIRTTIAMVPRRLPVLYAKAGVLAAVTLVSGLVATAASSMLGRWLLQIGWTGPGLGPSTMSHEPVLQAVSGGALYLVGVSITGVALGMLLRATAGAVTAVIGVYFVLPPVLGLLPAGVSADIRPWLPSWAGSGLWAPAPSGLEAWPGFALYVGYVTVLVLAGAVRLVRTDV